MLGRTIIHIGLLFISASIAQFDQFPVHPAWELVDLKAADFNAKAGGMGWLSDGRMAYADFGLDIVDGDPGSNRPKHGKVIILGNLESENPDQITRKVIATGLWQPLGLAVVNDKIYVAEKEKISVYAETSPGNFENLPNETLTGWDFNNIWGQWAMGLVYKDSAFYLNLAVGWQGSPHPDATSGRASVIKVTLDNKVSVVASGFRSHNGIGLNADGDIFVTENNGKWVPTEYLAHVKQGHYYGMRGAKENQWEFSTGPYQAPAVYIPHVEMGYSPSSPHLVKKGLYKGQFLITDYRWGQIGRYFLEKVNGDWQGAIYRFSGGFEAGPHRMLMTEDENEIYVGGLGGKDPSGNCGNWCWKNTHYGFQKMKRKTPAVDVFEILSTRSRNNGLELEFTLPIDEAKVVNSQFKIEQYGYTIQSGYGGGQKTNKVDLSLIDFQISPDKKKLFLEIGGMVEERVVHITIDSTFVSEGNESLWDGHSYYTQNNISASNAFDIHGCTKEGFQEYNPDATFDDGSCLTGIALPKNIYKNFEALVNNQGDLVINSVTLNGKAKLYQLNGTQVNSKKLSQGKNVWKMDENLKGVYLLRLTSKAQTFSKTIVFK